MIGKTIEGYRIVTELGSGPTGDVWFAERTEGEGRAAIKVLKPDLCSHDERLEAVVAEINAVSELGHTGIAAVESVGRLDGSTFVVEELLEGETLEERLDRKERPTAREVARIGMLIADAVQAAHEAGMYLHRGIKPQNVFLVDDGVKITDFGVDLLLADSEPIASAVRYSAPEICRGDTAVDHRADVYSLGALLYHLATGHPPFEADEPDELVVAHTTTEPRPARERHAGVPTWLDRHLARALAKDPDDRFDSMGAFAEALREGMARLPEPPAPPGDRKQSSPRPPPPAVPKPAVGNGGRTDSDSPEVKVESMPPEVLESLPPEELDSVPPEGPDDDAPEGRGDEEVEEQEASASEMEAEAQDEPEIDVGAPAEEPESDDEPAAQQAEAEAEGPLTEHETDAEAADGTDAEAEDGTDAEAEEEKRDSKIRIFNSEPPPLEERQRRVVDKLSRAIVQSVLSGSLELPGAPEGVTAFARLVTETSSEIDAAEVLESDEALKELVGDRWDGALFVAELARGLAMETGEEVDPRLAYLAPLVLEAGRPLVAKALPAVEKKLKEPDSKYVDGQVREEVIELCHREVAVSLAYAWGIPPAIPQALPTAGTLTDDEPKSLQNVLTLAIALAMEAGKFSSKVGIDDLVKHLDRGRELLGTDESTCEGLVAGASKG